jgi:self-protective colicin-like immunity protein
MMQDIVEQVRRLFDHDKYEEAVRLAEEFEKKGTVSPALLLWKSRSLLLSDDLQQYKLDDVERWLQHALTLDPDYLPALTELGFFYLHVMDDVRKAWPLFERAREVCTEDATDTVIGLGECIAELDSPKAALNFLNQQNLLLDESQLKTTKSDLETTAETWTTVDRYIHVMMSFVENKIDASEFERSYLLMFKEDTTNWTEAEYESLNYLFGEVDAFCADPELRGENDIDDDQLREATKTTLAKLLNSDRRL